MTIPEYRRTPPTGAVFGHAAGNVRALLNPNPPTENYWTVMHAPVYDEARQRGEGAHERACPKGDPHRVPAGRDGSQYNAFGETVRATGVAADVNPFRFSTKYQDNESGLYYYGFRYYSPGQGRFLNRDPINEPGSQLTRGRRMGSATLSSVLPRTTRDIGARARTPHECRYRSLIFAKLDDGEYSWCEWRSRKALDRE